MNKKFTENQIENPKVFWTILFLFLSTLVIIVVNIGAVNNKTQSVKDLELNTNSIKESSKNDSLDDYFGDISESISIEKNDAFIQSDPFRDMCNESGAGNGVIVTFGTVCFR